MVVQPTGSMMAEEHLAKFEPVTASHWGCFALAEFETFGQVPAPPEVKPQAQQEYEDSVSQCTAADAEGPQCLVSDADGNSRLAQWSASNGCRVEAEGQGLPSSSGRGSCTNSEPYDAQHRVNGSADETFYESEQQDADETFYESEQQDADRNEFSG